MSETLNIHPEPDDRQSAAAIASPPGTRIIATGLTTRHRGGVVALNDISLEIEPRRLTAIIGPSGAGKTTLLAALAGVSPAQQGQVTFEDPDVSGPDARVGFVPQDDILHGELPLQRTLQYAAALRMKAPGPVIDEAVDLTMDTLGLTEYSDVPVHSLSGGQRKRANIACEILTRPSVCFLDEPTSGLDPAAAAGLINYLHRMCAAGSTIVLTTHNVEDIERSDQVVVIAPGGRLVAVGTPLEVLSLLGASSFAGLYEQLAASRSLGDVTLSESTHQLPAVARPATTRRASRLDRPSGVRQWWTLTRRAAEILTRNRLTLSILLGSPAAVIAMFAVLFRPHSFSSATADPTAAIQVAYWLSFSGFFFGLTFGLLQICTEVPVLRREHYAGMRLGAYLWSKVALLTPVLILVNTAMIVVLEALHRIPNLSARSALELSMTMGLNALAALCLGLLASAVVTTAAQAALALPMLCFPAVLFSGAMVPNPVMADAGRTISAAMSDRWAFEAIARQLHVAAITGPGSPYAGLGASSFPTYWTLLAIFSVATGAGAYLAVSRRARSAR
jgi:ABC-type multidrug transport system ATPase subunit